MVGSNMPRFIRVTVCVIALLSLPTGCAGSGENPPPPEESQVSEEAARDQARAQCLREKGFDVELLEGGGVGMGLPREQVDAFQAANDECDEALGFQTRPLGEDELRELYASYMNSAQCLREKGYEIGQAPSLQEFIDGFATSPWTPWLDLPAEQVITAIDECPMPAPIY